jgi:hypothetical protein
MKNKIARCARWAVYLEIPTLLVGLALFLGSLHSGGISIYLSGVFVPPLFLYIYGVFQTGSFLMWLVEVIVMQYGYCLIAVCAFNVLGGSIKSGPRKL